MKRAGLSWLLLLPLLALQACDREPPITIVESAGPSLPDATPRDAPEPVAPPTAPGDLPAFHDQGDALGAHLLMQRMLFLPVACCHAQPQGQAAGGREGTDVRRAG
jgi:hypothetical protein